ncbi:unnamed protein product [Angiostrongylus costaricensis]|uniref:Ground-like domain-containing protein n=1 Tax=Angiostrongylus costaricensis TaxID=334426 RepID=A0A0R3PK57_ANGCS|nr:unnamed protein product [Angiostrongylus costaricensis]
MLFVPYQTTEKSNKLRIEYALFFGGAGSSCSCATPPVCPPPIPVPSCAPASGGSYASAPYKPLFSASQRMEPAYLLVPPAAPPVPLPPFDGNIAPVQKVDHSTSGGPGPSKLKSNDASDMYMAPSSEPRARRDSEVAFDAKCNSEALREIILENMHGTTAESKRQIQEVATEELGGRIDVICSTGSFSYIVNTEYYCEAESNGLTCLAFRQSS